MTIREALARGASLLAAEGNDTAALDASLLLAEVLNITRTSLIAAGPDKLADEAFDAFQKLLNRRLDGECAAYILGRKEFRGLDFAVNPSVLVPRPDTETLVEAAIERLTLNAGRLAAGAGRSAGERSAAGSAIKKPLHVLDLCTGSGAVAIALKNEMPELELWASDISAGALKTAKANAARLLPAINAPIHFMLGDIYEALTSDPPCESSREKSPPSTISGQSGRIDAQPVFSLIVSNPPYIPGEEIERLPIEVKKEPRIALDGGTDGLDIIRTIIKGAPNHLHAGGALLLEADPGQMKSIAVLLAAAGFGDMRTYRDLSGQERVIGGAKQPHRV
jgi:release factor glutamine methyltransferase